MRLVYQHQIIEAPNERFEGNSVFIDALNAALDDWERKDSITISTSGSTGKPKEIQIPRAAVLKSIEMTAEFFGLEAGSKALLCLPVDKIAGRMMLYRALDQKWDLTIVEPSGHPLKTLDGHFDFVAMTPMQVSASIECERDAFRNIKTLIIGGAATSDDLQTALQAFDLHSYETFGMTETVTHIAARRLTPIKDNYFSAMPGVRFRASEKEQLIIDTPHLGSIQTNDRVDLINERQFVWLGRLDNVINSGGIKLQPEPIEASIRSLIDRRFYVIGRPDDKLGEALTLVIEGSEFSQLEIQQLQKEMNARLSKFEIPKQVEFLEKFQETSTGKIIRK